MIEDVIGKDEDVVKLYDLTSLCSESLVDQGQNPFTVPVAMLLYRVARNMKHSVDRSTMQPGTIRALLNNCLMLLPKEKYPQVRPDNSRENRKILRQMQV